MATPRYLVTGATGLIGRRLCPLLAARGELTLLVRPSSLERNAAYVDSLGAEVVPADLSLGGLGVEASARQRLEAHPFDHVFHLAALYDLEAGPEVLEQANVGGTRRLLALLREVGFDGTLHHVSSVAVAGDHAGLFPEDELDLGQGFPHPYHRSKHESERLVRESGARFRIYRPSAVVGERHTGAMDRLDGPYYLFVAVHRLRRMLPPWVTLPGIKGGPIDMVPVDWVAETMDRIAHTPGQDGKTFHLVDGSPPFFSETFNLIAAAAEAPRMGKPRLHRFKQLMPAASMLGQLGAVGFFRERALEDWGIPPGVAAAMNREVRYDTTNLEAVVGPEGRCPPQHTYVEKLWDHYLRHLDPRLDPVARVRGHLSGKRVLVTGASSGIGRALAIQAAEAGAEVVLVARRREELEAAAAECRAHGGRAHVRVVDLTDFEAIDALAADVLATVGPIDVLVNNAGHSIRRPLKESLARFHDLERLMQLNYLAPARLVRGFLPQMRERRTGQIVNVLSAGTHMPSPRFGAYTASKAALDQLGNVLAAEHADEGITVTSAFLPWVRTPMMGATGKYDDTRAMSPEEAAAWILEGVVERRRFVVSGHVKRRFIWNLLAPDAAARVLNVLYRIYADDPKEHPELDLDRALLKQVVKGRLM